MSVCMRPAGDIQAANIQPAAIYGQGAGNSQLAGYQMSGIRLQQRQTLIQQVEINCSTALLPELLPPVMLAAWIRAVVRIHQGGDPSSQGNAQVVGVATIASL